MVLRALHLFSGYGGFELALRGYARTVAHVERDAYAAAALVARMGEARLDQAPVWSDVTTFDGRPWRGRVDLITAGFPCQPFSTAGKQLGVDDDRWLWPSIARLLAEVEPRYVFLENVPQLVRHGLPEVLHDLARLGFDAEWGLLSASAVGAPHKRERFWLLAHAHDDAWGWRGSEQQGRADAAGPGPAVADAERITRGESDGRQPVGRREGHSQQARVGGEAVADAAGVDEREPHHPARPVTRGDARQDTGWRGFPPPPGDDAGWADWIAQGGPQPGVRRGTDGAPPWLADALHLGGNGLVPQCARAAWELLTERLGKD